MGTWLDSTHVQSWWICHRLTGVAIDCIYIDLTSEPCCLSAWLMSMFLFLSVFLQEYLSQFYDGWRDLMDNKSDPRTRDYPLMSSPFPTIAISLAYAYFVKVSAGGSTRPSYNYRAARGGKKPKWTRSQQPKIWHLKQCRPVLVDSIAAACIHIWWAGIGTRMQSGPASCKTSFRLRRCKKNTKKKNRKWGEKCKKHVKR